MIKRTPRFFVTGTDTEVGKTFVTCALLKTFQQQGLRTLALKPIAAGCSEQGGEWQNEDALQLQAAMTESLPYAQVNPIALRAAVAPHLAAGQEQRRLSVSRIEGLIRGALMTPADVILIEGAGGWLVPLNTRETFAQVVTALQLPVILVVAIRLGCLNHALLTAQAIEMAGLPLAGWVANCFDTDAALQAENIETLKEMIKAPCVGVLPRISDQKSDFSDYFNTDLLLKNNL